VLQISRLEILEIHYNWTDSKWDQTFNKTMIIFYKIHVQNCILQTVENAKFNGEKGKAKLTLQMNQDMNQQTEWDILQQKQCL